MSENAINTTLIAITFVAYFGFLVLGYKFFGRTACYAFTVFATVVGNVEVLMLVVAFGMEQTLGNVMFATTYTAAKILTEMEGDMGAQYAKKASVLSFCTTGVFMLITQSWAWYAPAYGDTRLQEVFQNSPRIMITSLVVYGICMGVQIVVYKAIWKLQKNSEKGVWLRSVVSTLIVQLVNDILFTLGAFLGVYDFGTLISIMIASYVLFILTSLWDMVVMVVVKKTCQNHNVAFKNVDG